MILFIEEVSNNRGENEEENTSDGEERLGAGERFCELIAFVVCLVELGIIHADCGVMHGCGVVNEMIDGAVERVDLDNSIALEKLIVGVPAVDGIVNGVGLVDRLNLGDLDILHLTAGG